jgi:trigger factor
MSIANTILVKEKLTAMKKFLCVLLAVAMLLTLAACNESKPDDNDPKVTDGDDDDDEHVHGPDCDHGHDEIEIGYVPPELEDLSDVPPYSHSQGRNELGYWQGVTALDYVELFNYHAFEIPYEVYTITDEELEDNLDWIAQGQPPVKVYDRAVQDGDIVNIDFVGSINGVEFPGGNSQGSGMYRTAGSNEFIDNFLTQIIGHMPGETIDVYARFPEDYGDEELNGQMALFVTTINYISQPPEQMDDEFIKEHFYDDFGIDNAEDFRVFLRDYMQRDNMTNYVYNYIIDEVNAEIPDFIIETIESLMINSFREEAAQRGLTEFSVFIADYMRVEGGLAGLLASERANNERMARVQVVFQAIAEDLELVVEEENLEDYLQFVRREREELIQEYGVAFFVQSALHYMVLNYIFDNVVVV